MVAAWSMLFWYSFHRTMKKHSRLCQPNNDYAICPFLRLFFVIFWNLCVTPKKILLGAILQKSLLTMIRPELCAFRHCDFISILGITSRSAIYLVQLKNSYSGFLVAIDWACRCIKTMTRQSTDHFPAVDLRLQSPESALPSFNRNL